MQNSDTAIQENARLIVARAQTMAREALPGVTRRLLAHNARLMLCEHAFEANADLPRHAHPHEQVTTVVSGLLRLEMEGHAPFDMGPGDSVVIPGGTPHQARALQSTIALDVFTPCREDYLES